MKSIEPQKGVDRATFEFRMDALQMRVDQVERKIANKADDIVSVQIMHHRQEIDDIYEAIENIDEQMKAIEEQLNRFTEASTSGNSEKNSRNDSLRLAVTT
ncbi:hypothetical protein [Tuberibacillus sp. Marseille-P3662]|uniref:hypothetical protein n=1 Tax=Tuberibacillus sp. Marseille-P3662 TaxID=1965358 RepID=UPI000A1CB44E|nr:hypothetical protein [Tuberibacillus sp. Marseille-P3662]